MTLKRLPHQDALTKARGLIADSVRRRAGQNVQSRAVRHSVQNELAAGVTDAFRGKAFDVARTR
jgi:hypothetical protein